MNIVVCVKIEPDLPMLSVSDWLAVEQGEVECDFARRQLSGFDQSAAEMALGLAAQRLTLLTVGDEKTTPVLKALLALDFQRAVRIEISPMADVRFSPDHIAGQIAAFYRQEPDHSVMIFGSQTSEGQNRQTGLLLAEILGWPCLTQVCDIQVLEEGLLRVKRRTAEYVQTLTLRPPVVLIAGQDTQGSLLRIPTLKQKLGAAGKPLDVLPAQPIPESPRRLIGLRLNDTRRAGVIIQGESVQEMARTLCREYLQERWTS